MKLIIHEKGDTSVGYPETYYSVDCPFERNDVCQEDLDDFKRKLLDMYEDYAENYMHAFYDDEKYEP